MNKLVNPPPATPPGVPIPYPTLARAAKTGTPVMKTVADLLDALRKGMPYGPLAAMPKHYKDALNATGIATPTGPAALKQQDAIVRLEQKVKNGGGDKQLLGRELQHVLQQKQPVKNGGDDAQLANLDLQNALQKQQQAMQMMSNISKKMHDTALAVIRNIGG